MTTNHSVRTRPIRTRRKGAVMVWVSLLLSVLVGMVGLVVDGGLLMSSHRHAQNAADSAALAAAMYKLRGRPDAEAIASGVQYVTEHNGVIESSAVVFPELSNADVTINIPPESGPYAGNLNFVEAIVSAPLPTYFIHVLLPASGNTVNARAVAGSQALSAGEGVAVLDPNVRPGLRVQGGGKLRVQGDVLVNSLGGGVDENWDPVPGQQTAVSVSNNSTMLAENVYVAGGVNNPDNIQHVDGDDYPHPLHAGLGDHFPDPLLYLATPTTSNGVLDIDRGSPKATNNNLMLNNPNDDSGLPNYIEDPDTPEATMVLQPGIYSQIEIQGGRVRFEPGIYVLRPTQNTPVVLAITGGDVTANGIMFYNTGSNYDPLTGEPDVYDFDRLPGSTSGLHFGGVNINASMTYLPISTVDYLAQYQGMPGIEVFNGMLFYQRRWNTRGLQIQGNSADGNLNGTLYAKWSNVSISGQGTYSAQFVVGSMSITGQGDVTVLYEGEDLGMAPQVFLVE